MVTEGLKVYGFSHSRDVGVGETRDYMIVIVPKKLFRRKGNLKPLEKEKEDPEEDRDQGWEKIHPKGRRRNLQL